MMYLVYQDQNMGSALVVLLFKAPTVQSLCEDAESRRFAVIVFDIHVPTEHMVTILCYRYKFGCRCL